MCFPEPDSHLPGTATQTDPGPIPQHQNCQALKFTLRISSPCMLLLLPLPMLKIEECAPQSLKPA